MAQCYKDYYTEKNEILTMIEHGNPKQRQIALGSLVVHFSYIKTIEERNKYYELAWNLFISDEHFDVKKQALGTACNFATNKQLIKIAEFILNKTSDRNDLIYSARILRYIINKNKGIQTF